MSMMPPPFSAQPEDEGIPAADAGTGAPPPAPGFGVAGEDPDRAPETDRPGETAAGGAGTADTVFRTPDPDDVRRDPAG